MIPRRTFLQGTAASLVATAGLPVSNRAWGQPQAITGAFSAPGLAYASLFIANRRKMWAAQAIQPVMKQVEGGALAMVALNSGEADFVCVASTDAMISWERGLKLQVVAAFYGSLTIQLTARKEWLEKTGISPKSGIDDKVRALKGVRIGSSSLGGGPPQYTRFLSTLYGLDPQKDIRIVGVGQGPTRIAALREGRVDLIVGGAPEADQIALDGYGELFINFSEIPIFKEFPFTVVVVKEELAGKDPQRVQRVARTIGQANDFIRNNFEDAVKELQAQFPKINPAAIQRAMARDRNALPAGARMTEAMWANGYKCAAAMRSIKSTPPLAEGAFWTNRFLG
jgi:NitT/TauT family transport system substrate-binding protein